MGQLIEGKLTTRDQAVSRVLKWSPWLAFLLLSLPPPLVFLLLFLTATATDSAAVYLLLSLFSLGLGVVLGLLAVVVLILYRGSWLRRLRNRLAADGITANEVTWFTSELTSAERRALAEIQSQNPLLADAYLETLATRLTATRIRSRAVQELIRADRRINRARSLGGVDTAELIRGLETDRERYSHLKTEASSRLAEAQARLQTIEAAASRSMNQVETELMLQRLSVAQEKLPLVLEMAKLEEDALRESRLGLQENNDEE
ncbi:MAG TPA: hypothetical protein VE135_15030 [Pyrinomonadaceae bacterium]|nr:hypothetical protein [Pyrinomonadaceae bacterium]